MRKLFIIFIIFISISTQASPREQIRIVGSSTLYPFITISAERFGKISGHTPVVEANGTGGGFHLFCSGNSLKYPDIVNASRKMKKNEKNLCNKNGVNNIEEIIIGYDGIVISQSLGAKRINLNKKELFLALAKKIPVNQQLIPNKYTTWKEINNNLPDIKIEIYGPSFTSGTREALIELVMNDFCNHPECKEIREDGYYIEMPENDNMIIHKLIYNKKALGIISFSLLKENNKIKSLSIDGRHPTKISIIKNNYPLSRPLFIYVNKDHINYLPSIQYFVNELTNVKAIGPRGYLTQKGLITKMEMKYD